MTPADLRAKIERLEATRDPVARNALAIELLDDARRVLADVRRDALRDALASGMSQAEYARAIGVSPAAVAHLAREIKAATEG